MFSLSVNDKEPFPPGNKVSNISEKCTEIELNEDSILNDISFSISLICEINSFLAKFKSSIFPVISSCLNLVIQSLLLPNNLLFLYFLVEFHNFLFHFLNYVATIHQFEHEQDFLH